MLMIHTFRHFDIEIIPVGSCGANAYDSHVQTLSYRNRKTKIQIMASGSSAGHLIALLHEDNEQLQVFC